MRPPERLAGPVVAPLTGLQLHRMATGTIGETSIADTLTMLLRNHEGAVGCRGPDGVRAVGDPVTTALGSPPVVPQTSPHDRPG